MRSKDATLLPTSAFRVVLLALALAVAGCAKPPRLAPLPGDAVLLAFGDSLTYGTGAAESESYPAQLEQLIGRRVVRAGVPGEVTAGALARLPEALDEHSPQLLLLCIGGNDFLRRLGNAQAEANVRAMVKLARSRGIQVLLIGTPEPGVALSPPPFFGSIADEFRLPYVEAVVADVLKDDSLKSDPIHPNAKGYRVIAERVAGALKASGAI
jgi:lysophospholipase L1-like esterase